VLNAIDKLRIYVYLWLLVYAPVAVDSSAV